MLRDLPPSVAGYWQKRRVWDRYREEQHPIIGRVLEEQRQKTVAAVRDFAVKRPEAIEVADLCCGTGWVSCDVMALEKVKSLLAADINETALRRLAAGAARLGLVTKLRTRAGDVYSLDWGGPESFDVVLCLDALHHLPDVPCLLRDIRLRLKPDGMLVGNLRAAEATDFFFDRYGIVKRTLIRVQPIVDRLLPERSRVRNWLGSVGYFRIRTFRRADAERLLVEAGFEIEEMVTKYYHWFRARRT